MSDLILMGKIRHCQLTENVPPEIIVPLTKEEISTLWKDNQYWQIALTDFLGSISKIFPKLKELNS